MLDFNSRSALADRINYLVDERIAREEEAKPRRQYLGASLIGHACERHVQYQWLAILGQVERPGFEPRILRIFDRGNIYEERARQWLKAAGFLFGRPPAGLAFEDFGGQFRGHVDGVLTGWRRRDAECMIELPALWECKCLGAKGWRSLDKERLRNYSSTYFAQVQLYMHYLGLECCLFSAVNADTMEIYHELVPYDATEAQLCRARVATILAATEAGELLQRCTADPAYYICKWCDFRGGCWSCR